MSLNNISSLIMPSVVLIIIALGVIKGIDVFDVFCEGAKNGLITVFNILPVLIGLMCATEIFAQSGTAEILGRLFAPIEKLTGFPKELVPLLSTKMISSSAATAMLNDVFQKYGTDSFIGLTASIMMSCTETVFYTVSVYFSSVNIKNIRYTLKCCIIVTLCGAVISSIVASHI